MHLYVVAAIYDIFIIFVYYLLNLNLDADYGKPEKIFRNDKCFLYLDKASNPVYTSCGHEYCCNCILNLWKYNRSRLCPACRAPVDFLYPNFRIENRTKALIKEIDKFNSLYAPKSYFGDISRSFHP